MKKLILFTLFAGSGLFAAAQGLYKGGSGSGFAKASSSTLTLGRNSVQPQRSLDWVYDTEDLLLINQSGQALPAEIIDMQGRVLQTIQLQAISGTQRFSLQLPAGVYFVRTATTTISWVKP